MASAHTILESQSSSVLSTCVRHLRWYYMMSNVWGSYLITDACVSFFVKRVRRTSGLRNLIYAASKLFVYHLFKIQTFATFAATLWSPSFFSGKFLPKCLLIA